MERSRREADRGGPSGPAHGVALSPDEKRIAVSRGAGRELDIWLLEWQRGLTTRFTFHPSADRLPVWSPDGSRIAFVSNRDGGRGSSIYVKSASGAGSEELLLKSDAPKFLSDWSRDGRFLVYASFDPKTRSDLWVLPLPGDRKPAPCLQTEFHESYGQLSPDGKWMAYESDETGRFEIYVRPFPAASAGKWQVSTGGGGQPHWRSDGKELFYLGLDLRLMAVDVKAAGGAFERSTPKPCSTPASPALPPTRTVSARPTPPRPTASDSSPSASPSATPPRSRWC